MFSCCIINLICNGQAHSLSRPASHRQHAKTKRWGRGPDRGGGEHSHQSSPTCVTPSSSTHTVIPSSSRITLPGSGDGLGEFDVVLRGTPRTALMPKRGSGSVGEEITAISSPQLPRPQK